MVRPNDARTKNASKVPRDPVNVPDVTQNASKNKGNSPSKPTWVSATLATTRPSVISSFDGGYKPLPRRQLLSPAQLKVLLTGKTIDIQLGEPPYQYIAAQGVFANVIMHYSVLARGILARPGVTQLYLPHVSKDTFHWIYQYMASGETHTPPT
jgi:hypothetical protein